ncbi:unnamed protein product [Caenorhabditis sp. 36 PRJEB53466]|nr:unnamed protein product [Caenorhabditis sp. 36 PRJEB53466]
MIVTMMWVKALVLCGFVHGKYKDNTEFDEKMKEIIRKRAGGDPSFLREYVDDAGVPRSFRPENYTNPPYCFDIADRILTHRKYAECTMMSAVNGSTLLLKSFPAYDRFIFTVALLELKNVEVKLEYESELTYLYFSSFRKCDNCLFNFVKNPALVGLYFTNLENKTVIAQVPVHYRPKIVLRGNSRLKIVEHRKRERLMGLCNPELCNLQWDTECHFRSSIRSSEQYSRCRHVYGDMSFQPRFQEVFPLSAQFTIEGCFYFNRTGIRFVRELLKVKTNCSRQHVFEHNEYMCTDQIDEMKRHWGEDKVKVISDKSPIHCYQGECRGGFIAERHGDRHVGCEIFQGDVYVANISGNLTDGIRDMSMAHYINGRLQLSNNPSITDLPLPFLRAIKSKECPAFSIVNMTNLRNVVFHPHIEFKCDGKGPTVFIENAPKLFLHREMLTRMRMRSYNFTEFDYEIHNFGLDSVTYTMIGCCVAIIVVVEVYMFLRNSLLLPNFLYRLFPMQVPRYPRQKPVKKRKVQ